MTRWLVSAPLIMALATCSNALAPSQDRAATVTIRSDGMTPKEVTLNRGNRVTVLNLDSQPHRPMSDPHTEHSSCTALNFASIPPGARAESAVINVALDCRLHDEMNVGKAAFTTRILIGLQ
jgi:hypothetical protein